MTAMNRRDRARVRLFPAPPTRRRARLRPALLAASAVLGLSACAGVSPSPLDQGLLVRDTASLLAPRCVGVDSCLLGHVTDTATAAPVAKASVFLEREAADGEAKVKFTTLTDEQGVFTVSDPPPGSYRMAIYKEASGIELMGMQLGKAGTTVVPVRLVIQ